jgi:ADP-heptose:LPS heptosyltransferase
MSKIAVIRPGAVGDIIMILNSVVRLRESSDVTIFCHGSMLSIIKEFVNKNDICKIAPLEQYDRANFDKTIQAVGYPIYEGYPHIRMQKHLLEYFAKEMEVDFSFNNLNLSLPSFPTKIKNRDYPKHITVHNKTGWSVYKEWWGWQQLIDMMKQKMPDVEIYQIGGPNDPQINNTDGSFCGDSFEDNLAAQAWAVLHLGLDSVFNHTTNINWIGKGKTKGVILFGSTQADASGYPHNENISLGLTCQPCFKEDPKISRASLGVCDNPPNQTYDSPQHACMKGITPEMVFDRIKL